MKIKTAKWLCGAVLLMALLSAVLVIKNEGDTLFAWWLATILMLPGLLLALRSKFVSLKVFCLIAFVTQFITVPTFFLSRDEFAWGHAKPFGFNAVEVLPIFLQVGAFLLLLGLLFLALSRLPLFAVTRFKTGILAIPPQTDWLTNKLQKPTHNHLAYVVLILLVIAAVIPINLWMLSQGIGITGVEPPRLPYKLSGILLYLTKYLIPLLLGYFYYKTRHGLFLAMLLLVYALILGLSSNSRGAIMMVMLPVLAIALLERRKIVLFFSGLGMLITFSLISQARNFVYIVEGNKIASNKDIEIFVMLGDLISNTNIMDFGLLYSIFVGILERIEGFGNLVMSHYYDPNAVIGACGYILRMIWNPLAPIDLDLHHLQWQGNVLPEGFVNGGSLLSNIVIVANDNGLWIIAAALVVAVILLTLERCIQRITKKYELPTAIEMFMIIFMTITFFIGSGTVVFVFPFLAVLVVSWLPRVRISTFKIFRRKILPAITFSKVFSSEP